jgi:hypothetical protein
MDLCGKSVHGKGKQRTFDDKVESQHEDNIGPLTERDNHSSCFLPPKCLSPPAPVSSAYPPGLQREYPQSHFTAPLDAQTTISMLTSQCVQSITSSHIYKYSGTLLLQTFNKIVHERTGAEAERIVLVDFYAECVCCSISK